MEYITKELRDIAEKQGKEPLALLAEIRALEARLPPDQGEPLLAWVADLESRDE